MTRLRRSLSLRLCILFLSSSDADLFILNLDIFILLAVLFALIFVISLPENIDLENMLICRILKKCSLRYYFYTKNYYLSKNRIFSVAIFYGKMQNFSIKNF